jgi:integrase
MPKRCGRGEGSITQLADGCWQARVDLGWVDGKRKRKAIYGETRAEVAGKLIKALSDHQGGLPLPNERLTVEAYLRQWLDDCAKPTVRVSTYENYERKLRLHVFPTLGRASLAKLGPRELSGLYAKLLSRGLSPSTVQYVHAVLHRALDQALRWSLIPRIPAELVDAPRAGHHEVTVLSREQVSALLAVAAGDRLEALYILAVTGGLRLGELLGLRWSDLEWDAGILQVRRSLTRTKQNGLTFSEPKTQKGRRSVTLPSIAVEALRRHKARQNAEKMKVRDVWDEGDLLFPNEIGRPIERQNRVGRSFKVLLTKAGLPHIRFHDLRHTAATLLLQLGEHPKVVQERIGHATIGVTMDIYSHVMPDLQRDAATRLDRLLAAR